MRESIFNNFTKLFTSEPKKEKPTSTKLNIPHVHTFQAKVSSAEKKQKNHVFTFSSESKGDGFVDVRYEKVGENLQNLKSLGLDSSQILAGQIPIFYEDQKISCKNQNKKYQPTTIIVTNFKLCLKSKKNSYFYAFPLGKVEKLQKYVANSGKEKTHKVLIILKDGRKFKFKIDVSSTWKSFYGAINQFAFIQNKRQFFAFRHFQFNKELEFKYRGWKLYHPVKQFQRMKIKLMEHTQETVTQFTSDFKILDNENGRICQTYPEILVVPSRLTYESILKCAKFRSKERLPALSFVYQYSKNKFSSLYRSSQNKSGIQGSRSIDDELMLKYIGNPSEKGKTTKKVTNCCIYDARGYYAAFGNKFQGKGCEDISNYQNCTLKFLNIPNIHAVRESYLRMVEASFGKDELFFSTMADSHWYEYVFLILNGALELSITLSKGINILVHCSDGWDRTAQLCCLTSILLDPYYRTIQGFQILIEKDWISFGHQFVKRLGQGMNSSGSEQKSQVFLQYLDCITQLMHQFPHQFEFNMFFIDEIAEQAFSHTYGNFLSNCSLEMSQYNVKERTVSLWSKLSENRSKYLNKFYVPTNNRLFSLNTSIKNMRYWKEHFLKFVDGYKELYDKQSIRFTEESLKTMCEKANLNNEDEDEQYFEILGEKNSKKQSIWFEEEENKQMMTENANFINKTMEEF